MSDDTRYRSDDLFARTPDSNGHGSDPLAELARLIGQGEQFAEIGRDPRNDPPPREPQYYDDPPPEQHDQRYDDQHAYDAQQDGVYPADPEPLYPAEPEPQHYADAGSHAPDPVPAHDWREQPQAQDWREPPPLPPPAPVQDWQSAPRLPAFDPFSPSSRQLPEPPLADDRAPPPFPPRAPKDEFSFAAMHAQNRDIPRPPSRDLPPPPLGTFDRHDLDPPPMPAHLAAGGPPSQSLDEYYDDAPQGRRGKGLFTVMAVFMLAILGTGAAFGYRTWFGGPTVKGAPAVIRANAEPTKVAPPAPAADPNSNKISYDRFADRSQNEKVVPREEKPVDIKEATRNAAATPPVALPSAQPSTSPSAAQAAANPPSVLTDPKRVRTVTIRPDQADPTAVARAPAAAAAAAPMRQSAAAPAPSQQNAPLDLANPQQARASAARPSPPPAAVRPAPAPTSANSPLSLAPENAPLPPPGTSPSRVASAPPVAASSGGNGNFLVQVSSQRSEADAQAAYRSLRSKYSGVLGDRPPVIRRAEIAGKGTYYRAMVGPFTTRDQAVQLCSSLKASGGDCVVQAN